jgi:preprotein translocase subunit SecF
MATKTFSFDFMGNRRYAVLMSSLAALISALTFFVQGINLGIDFTGGTLVELGFAKAAPIEQVRTLLRDKGFSDASVQEFGRPEDLLIRLAPREEIKASDLGNQVLAAAKESFGAVELRRVEFVGPQVGDELTEDGSLAVLITMLGILLYVALRFEWRFSIGAVIATIHDVFITLGVFALMGMEFGLPVLAAVLALIGYSLNDTVVVFDRIRENFRKVRKGTPEQIINMSINETLSRTIMTSFATMLAVLALYLLGGEVIEGFAFTLLVGILIGTYSSIYVASVAALWLGVSKADLMPVQKEGAADDRP